MFAIGDKVVYPMHGAGVIEAIEKHEVFGEMKEYYVMTMPHGCMRVMIPLNNVDNIGLREVIGIADVPKVATILQAEQTVGNPNWNRRFNANLTKIKSGNIYEVAEVVRNLVLQDRAKKLSTGERRLLDNAWQILVSELVLVSNKDKPTVEEWINNLLGENTPAH